MKERVAYIAYDGTEWETREECERHEADYYIFDKVLKHTQFFDKDGKPLDHLMVNDASDADECLRMLDAQLNLAYYIKITDVDANDVECASELIIDMLGQTFPNTPGIFHWDEDHWESWKDALHNFTNIWHPVIGNVLQLIKNILTE